MPSQFNGARWRKRLRQAAGNERWLHLCDGRVSVHPKVMPVQKYLVEVHPRLISIIAKLILIPYLCNIQCKIVSLRKNEHLFHDRNSLNLSKIE